MQTGYTLNLNKFTEKHHVLVVVVSYLQKNTMCKWSAVFCRSRCSVGCYPLYFFYAILILCLRTDATCLGYIQQIDLVVFCAIMLLFLYAILILCKLTWLEFIQQQ